MADQRIMMKCGDDEIVFAVRHSNEWRRANDARNDIGAFLTRNIGSENGIEISFEHEPGFADPKFVSQQTVIDLGGKSIAEHCEYIRANVSRLDSTS